MILPGKLLQAATMKQDETVLRQVRHSDPVAVEMQYHNSCYMMYTKFLYRPPVEESAR